MIDDELAISDVIADDLKNFCNIYSNADDEDEAGNIVLSDSLYHTETEFLDLSNSRNLSNQQNLTIISINIANLLTKLQSLKLLIHNISTPKNTPDIIVVVETHLTKTTNAGYTDAELRSIIPGYEFFHNEQSNRKGEGVGIFEPKKLSRNVKIVDQLTVFEELFENLII